MASGKEFVSNVIDQYRELPCLWKTTNEYYHDKNKRNEAIETIIKTFREVDPNATKEMVIKKLQSLRSAFRKELNKVKASERSGASADDVHVPKLWYYNQMLFLEDQEIPRTSRSVLSILDNMPFGHDDEESQDEEGLSAKESSDSSTPQSFSGFKRPRTKADKVLDKIAKKLDEPLSTTSNPAKQSHDAFGLYVAEQLRSMPENMVPYCQRIINEAIFFGHTNALNMDSKIYNEIFVQEEEN